MEIKFKNNVIFEPHHDNKFLKEKILNFILESKTDKILYKGNPYDINYKLLKKILPINNIDKSSTSTYNYVEKTENVRDIYNEFLNKINCKYCLIYKI